MQSHDRLHYPQPSQGSESPLVVLSTAPNEQVARKIGQALVEERLAACVNLGAPSLSIYQWQGKLESDTEVALTIKTYSDRLTELAERLSSLHPYEVPELLVLDVAGGATSYLEWMRTQTQPVVS